MSVLTSGSMEPLHPRRPGRAREVVLAGDRSGGGPPLLPRSETFQVVKVGGRRILLSALDQPVSIGALGEMGGDFTADKALVVFAESVTIAGAVHGPDLEVCAHTLDVLAGSNPTLDASGTDGKSWALQSAPTGDGADGGDGDPGGAIRVFVETLPDAVDALLRLRAKGGDGGEGQTAVDGEGGGGGTGAAGGDVQLFFSNRDLAELGAIRRCLSDSDQGARIDAARAILRDLTSDADRYAGLAPEVDALAAALRPKKPDPQHVQEALVAIAYGLEARVEDVRTRIIARSDVSGGAYGVRGSGFTGEKRNGDPGQPGTVRVQEFRTEEPADRPSTFVFAHPDQCRMLLDKARIAYFVGSDDLLRDAAILVQRAMDRTAFAVDLADDSPLSKLYAEKGDDCAVVDGIAELARLHDRASQLLTQLRLGNDYYGHAAIYAPLLSESFYQGELDRQLDYLEKVEAAYTAYYEALEKQQATVQHVRDARAQARAAIEDARTDLAHLGPLADQTARSIAIYEPEVEKKKQALLDAMKGLEDEVGSKFKVDWNDLFGALTTVAFAPNKFMVGVQVSSILYKGIEQIPNDQGGPVNKKYLISGIRSSEANVQALAEGFTAQKDGTLAPDDPAAAKLVVARDEFDKMMKDLSGELSDLKDVRQAFDDYVATVVERNNQLLRYNAILNTEWDRLAKIRTYEARLQQLSDEALEKLRPDLPAVAGFVSRLFHDARDRVLETLYSTSRAYRFWALSDRDPVQETFAGVAPPAIDTKMLRAVQVTLLGDLADGLQALRHAPQRFPSPDPLGPGVILPLEPEQVDTLRTENQLLFRIDPVMPDTRKAESPFAGWANIRLRRVRAWLDGATTSDGEIQVAITQLGREQVVDTSGARFEFTHDAIPIGFRYKTGEKPVPIEDGDIASDSDDRFAPVGPFAWWQIEVRPEYNRDLDLSGLTGVRLEFFGSNYTF